MNKNLTVFILCLGFASLVSGQALTFEARTTNASIAVGDTVYLDVTTKNFSSVEYFQYTTEWNPGVLEFINVIECNSDINLNCKLKENNFNIPSPGELRVSWFDANIGQTLVDDSKIYTVRFKAVADGAMNIRFSDNGLIREAQTANGFFQGDRNDQ